MEISSLSAAYENYNLPACAVELAMLRIAGGNGLFDGMFGPAASRGQGAPFLDCVYTAEGKEIVLAAALPDVRSGRMWRGEGLVKTGGGKALAVIQQFIPVFEADGSVRFCFVTFEDVSGRKDGGGIAIRPAPGCPSARVYITGLDGEIIYSFADRPGDPFDFLDLRRLSGEERAAAARGTVWSGIGELVRADGTKVCVERTVCPLFDSKAELAGFADITRDISEFLKLHGELKKGAERNQIILDDLPLGCVVCSGEFDAISCNEQAVKIFGADKKSEVLSNFRRFFMKDQSLADQSEAQPMKDRSDGLHFIDLNNEIRHQLKHHKKIRFKWTLQSVRGEAIPCEITMIEVTSQGETNTIVYINDLRELNKVIDLMNKLKITATLDGLTGLLNRGHFDETAFAMFAGVKAENKKLIAMMLDLDKFKAVNDAYGHYIGDLVLKETAKIIREALRPEDLCGRYGGEEFVILLPDVTMEYAVAKAEDIRKNIEALTIDLNGVAVKVTISIGAALSRKNMQTHIEVVRCADQALYQAKSRGRNRVEVYHDDRAYF